VASVEGREFELDHGFVGVKRKTQREAGRGERRARGEQVMERDDITCGPMNRGLDCDSEILFHGFP
jgi:hypothetical protein